MEFNFEFTIVGGDPDQAEKLFEKIVDYAEENGLKIAGGFHVAEAERVETEAEDGEES